ncbi:UDP-N-acetylmuramate dehydrogenase [Govanella unica]|uniref:UDP-N-acetylenolpyruvoylglucosamine reductase n=1 Tax=Govanella unica TaxID=2975056 RepID=A0A9X3TZY5_9PROT|nr:UDP-N-acetylmuramate dehydrogenase [Govania unica]MDA5195080.1 UDP-N-acetylmuramate dehydrogenase [Govania unica]
MTTPQPAQKILDRLPPVRGRYDAGASLAEYTWFRVGGAADVLFRPADTSDLVDFLRNVPVDLPLSVIGLGSNLLVRDGGVDGVVIRLGKAFGQMERVGRVIRAGGGASDISVASFARDEGLGGLEFLRGIPGTIGGALRMNAGAYGHEVADVLVAAEALDRHGNLHRLTPDEMGFSYRKTRVPEDWIFVSGEFRGTPDDPAVIAARMDRINEAREESQPLRTRTGGSTFKNPTSADAKGRRAWELVDEAGCRGHKVGGAEVSAKHCNFLINSGTATATDIERLGEDVRRRVKDVTGVSLDWEIRRIGRRPKEGPKT